MGRREGAAPALLRRRADEVVPIGERDALRPAPHAELPQDVLEKSLAELGAQLVADLVSAETGQRHLQDDGCGLLYARASSASSPLAASTVRYPASWRMPAISVRTPASSSTTKSRRSPAPPSSRPF